MRTTLQKKGHWVGWGADNDDDNDNIGSPPIMNDQEKKGSLGPLRRLKNNGRAVSRSAASRPAQFHYKKIASWKNLPANLKSTTQTFWLRHGRLRHGRLNFIIKI